MHTSIQHTGNPYAQRRENTTNWVASGSPTSHWRSLIMLWATGLLFAAAQQAAQANTQAVQQGPQALQPQTQSESQGVAKAIAKLNEGERASLARNPMMDPKVTLDRLKTMYLQCDRAISEAAVGPEIAALCSQAHQALLVRGFEGEFSALLEWWKRAKTKSVNSVD